MFELLTTALFLWLAVKAIGLCLRLTWGITKLAVGLLIVLAFPALLGCLLFMGDFGDLGVERSDLGLNPDELECNTCADVPTLFEGLDAE